MSNAFWLAWGPPIVGLGFGLVSVSALALYARAFDRKYGRGGHTPAE